MNKCFSPNLHQAYQLMTSFYNQYFNASSLTFQQDTLLSYLLVL